MGRENAIDFLVNKEDLHKTKTQPAQITADTDLAKGQVLLNVDHFAFTANNITYAVMGETMSYWDFFPTDDGWGRVPVWGFADVAKSNHPGISEGQRFYGYFPMSSYLLVEPVDVSPGGFTDGAAHRKPLPPIYNRYALTDADPAYEPGSEDMQMLFRPLFTTSFLLDDFIADNDFFGAKTAIISSASSKTALGTAFLMSRRNTCRTIGLTSSSNVDFVKGLGVYDEVVAYEDIGELDVSSASVLLDVAGSAEVKAKVHHHFGDQLKYSCTVGASHWQAVGDNEDLPGPTPSLFFAPSQAEKRMGEWGSRGFQQRLSESWQAFIKLADGWSGIKHSSGPKTAAEIYLATLDNQVPPNEGHIISL
jgi:hypothetical protein